MFKRFLFVPIILIISACNQQAIETEVSRKEGGPKTSDEIVLIAMESVAEKESAQPKKEISMAMYSAVIFDEQYGYLIKTATDGINLLAQLGSAAIDIDGDIYLPTFEEREEEYPEILHTTRVELSGDICMLHVDDPLDPEIILLDQEVRFQQPDQPSEMLKLRRMYHLEDIDTDAFELLKQNGEVLFADPIQDGCTAVRAVGFDEEGEIYVSFRQAVDTESINILDGICGLYLSSNRMFRSLGPVTSNLE